MGPGLRRDDMHSCGSQARLREGDRRVRSVPNEPSGDRDFSRTDRAVAGMAGLFNERPVPHSIDEKQLFRHSGFPGVKQTGVLVCLKLR